MPIIMRHTHLTPETPEHLKKTRNISQEWLWCKIFLWKYVSSINNRFKMKSPQCPLNCYTLKKSWEGNSWKNQKRNFALCALLYLSPFSQNKIEIQISWTAAVLAIFFRWEVQNIPVLKGGDTVFTGREIFPNPHKIVEFSAKGCILRFIRAQALVGTVCRPDPCPEHFALHSHSQWTRMLNNIRWKCI